MYAASHAHGRRHNPVRGYSHTPQSLPRKDEDKNNGPTTKEQPVNNLLLIGADLLAISILTFALYLRRHRRRDLMVSYLGVNVGVLAVAAALTGSTAGVGLGLGLFGVLSIIRLRSTELAQHEVAYYFAALALGLIGGIGVTPIWLGLVLMVLIVGTLWVGDHPAVLPRYRHQEIVLDRAIGNDSALKLELENLLDARVHSFSVKQLDLVNDKTLVDVRFETPRVPALKTASLAGDSTRLMKRMPGGQFTEDRPSGAPGTREPAASGSPAGTR